MIRIRFSVFQAFLVNFAIQNTFRILSFELPELLHVIFIHGVQHVKYLKTSSSQIVQEQRKGHDGDALAGDVINVILPFLHAVDVFLQAGSTVIQSTMVVATVFQNDSFFERLSKNFRLILSL